MTPLYTEEVHMLEGLDNKELETYLEENPEIVPFCKIDVIEMTGAYATSGTIRARECESDMKALMELHRVQDAFYQEMEISRRVMTSTLEEINVETSDEPCPLLIAKDLPPSEKAAMIDLLHEYKDVFAWPHNEMKGLDPKFYQHKINLATDAKPVQQRRYRMNPNYAARVKEKIDKLLKIGFIRPVKQAICLSPIVVIPKKNDKIRVCVDYRKWNTVTITDAFLCRLRIAYSTPLQAMKCTIS